ncbi:MAG TPA: hypothetical protein VFS96_08105 [Nitrolancea sp.]|nr:hypothetical protein [Nitrolancea sp.]
MENPWALATVHPTLLSYTIVGMREELGTLAERRTEIAGKLEALEALKDRSWRRTKLGRLFISSAIRDLQAELECLELRHEEIRTWLPDLEAHYTADYVLYSKEDSLAEEQASPINRLLRQSP